MRCSRGYRLRTTMEFMDSVAISPGELRMGLDTRRPSAEWLAVVHRERNAATEAPPQDGAADVKTVRRASVFRPTTPMRGEARFATGGQRRGVLLEDVRVRYRLHWANWSPVARIAEAESVITPTEGHYQPLVYDPLNARC